MSRDCEKHAGKVKSEKIESLLYCEVSPIEGGNGG